MNTDNIGNYNSFNGNGEAEILTKDTDIKIRHRFVRKVFGLVAIQLIITVGFVCLFLLCKSVNTYSRSNPWLLYVSLYLIFFIMLELNFHFSTHLLIPYNKSNLLIKNRHISNSVILYLLSTFDTVGYSILVAYVSSLYEAKHVISAVGVTFIVVVALMAFASQTKYDFTGWAPYLVVISLCLLFFGILAILFRDRVVYIIYAAIGSLICCLYIVFDTQMIIGGKRHELPVDYYVLGAITLYIDLITLYTYILMLFGLAGDA